MQLAHTVAQQGRPQPEQLAQELKVVLKGGCRAVKVRFRLNRLPNLIQVCARDIPDDQPWEQAIAICRAVEHAVANLGDGPYGRAVAALFSVSSATQGLLLPARRRAAAGELGVEVATLVRHWENEMVLDVGVNIFHPGERD